MQTVIKGVRESELEIYVKGDGHDISLSNDELQALTEEYLESDDGTEEDWESESGNSYHISISNSPMDIRWLPPLFGEVKRAI